MQLQFVGCGDAFGSGGRFNTCFHLVGRNVNALIDCGATSLVAMNKLAINRNDIDTILITHFHADHVVDLTALVKSGFFSERDAALTISGPSAGGEFPSLHEFLRAQFDEKAGAFRYLSGALDGSGGLFKLEPKEIDAGSKAPAVVLTSHDVKVSAIGVPHGPVPALAYRVDVGGLQIVFSGDQNGSAPAFWELAHDADLLVMAHAVPEDADRVARKLHAVPSVIGAGAADAHVRRLVLTHLMARSIDTLDANLALIRQRYSGPIDVAHDLACYPLAAPASR